METIKILMQYKYNRKKNKNKEKNNEIKYIYLADHGISGCNMMENGGF
jgi:hypothetical protein